MARIGKFFFFDGSENLATVFYYHVRSNGGVVESIGCVDNTSSFLEQSSFLLSPSGYKEDTVFTQKPIGATGNLTFTRGSDAWRTNVQGLVERTPWNIVRYSQDFENAAWTKTNTTVTSNITTAPDGSLTADLIVGTVGLLSDLRTTTAYNSSPNTVYTWSLYVKAAGYNYVRFTAWSSDDPVTSFNLSTVSVASETGPAHTSTITDVGNGWRRITITRTTGASSGLWIRISPSPDGTISSGDGVSGIYIWGGQIVEGAYPLEYFPTTDRLDVPRIDYSYGTCPALLLEPQRTNLVLQSEDLTNGWSTEGLTITANQTTAPDGNITADTLQETAVTDVHRVYRAGITTVSSTNYAFSFYVKKDTRRYVRLVLNQTTNSAIWAAAQFDLDNQTFTSGVGSGGGTFVSASISPASNGFYRITLVATVTSTITFAFLALSDGTAISSADSRGCNSYAGNTSNRIWGWGAQLEAGAYPTSYIKTEATTVTRLADSFSRNNIYTNNLITSAGGTWFVELRNNISYIRDVAALGIELKDASSNRIHINTFGGGNRNSINISVSSVTTELYRTLTDTVKIVIKWNGSTITVFVNGVKVSSGTSFSLTQLETLAGNSADVSRFIQAMALYPIPLSDVDCELLTNPTSSGYSSFASMASSLGYILI